MATTKADKTKAKADDKAEDKDPSYPYEGDPADIPAGASKPQGEKVSQVSGGGEPSEAPLADHHDVAYRDRDPGIVGDGGSVSQGGTKPGQRTIPSDEGRSGTLVENIPDMREQNRRTSMSTNTQPEKVGKQPDEK